MTRWRSEMVSDIAPPEGFIDLLTASKQTPGTHINVIAAAEDGGRSGASKTGYLTRKVSLYDHSSNTTNGTGLGKKIMLDFSSKYADELPLIESHGDIVLLRQVKVQSWNGQQTLSNDFKTTSFLVFPRSSVPSLDFAESYMGGKQRLPCRGTVTAQESLTLAETQYIIRLKGLANSPTATQTSRSSHATTTLLTSQMLTADKRSAKRPAVDSTQSFERRIIEYSLSRKKFRLIGDVTLHPSKGMAFADLCVELLRKRHDGYRYEILVADYTESQLLYDRLPPEAAQAGHGFGTRHDLHGPYGRRILKVVLMPPERDFVDKHIQPGNIIFMENVKLKPDNYGHLQGDMWPDGNKVHVQRMFDQSISVVHDLLQRKTAYDEYQRQLEPKETVHSERAVPVYLDKATKAREKKRRRKERKEAEAQAMKAETLVANQHIRCSAPEIVLTSIREILDQDNRRHTNVLPGGVTYTLPFINASYRAKVQVLDFYPDKLEQFAIPIPAGEGTLDDEMLDCAGWEWSFALRVQDAGVPKPGLQDQIVLNVGHKEAQFLLGSEMPDPDDLSAGPQLLARLRERLYILWGDLEERKQTGDMDLAPSNRPFQCCISEYGFLQEGGHPEDVGDWSKQYMMHGVTIL